MSKSLFEKVMFNEADGDETDPVGTEIPATDTGDNTPPDIGNDEAPGGETPPDIPDINFEDDVGDGTGSDGELEEPEIGEKISAVMNAKLYQRFLTLSNTIANQLSTLNGNNDIIFTVAPEALEQIQPMSKLAENIQLYLSHNFLESNYSTNLLFYNKCLNMLNILNNILTRELRKGNKSTE